MLFFFGLFLLEIVAESLAIIANSSQFDAEWRQRLFRMPKNYSQHLVAPNDHSPSVVIHVLVYNMTDGQERVEAMKATIRTPLPEVFVGNFSSEDEKYMRKVQGAENDDEMGHILR
uniref:Uncharacterized protein n=1 Tax=Romanomermis culicivorax TaxID=13658 RepID=A0A915L4B0_ROMCU